MCQDCTRYFQTDFSWQLPVRFKSWGLTGLHSFRKVLTTQICPAYWASPVLSPVARCVNLSNDFLLVWSGAELEFEPSSDSGAYGVVYPAMLPSLLKTQATPYSINRVTLSLKRPFWVRKVLFIAWDCFCLLGLFQHRLIPPTSVTFTVLTLNS